MGILTRPQLEGIADVLRDTEQLSGYLGRREQFFPQGLLGYVELGKNSTPWDQVRSDLKTLNRIWEFQGEIPLVYWLDEWVSSRPARPPIAAFQGLVQEIKSKPRIGLRRLHYRKGRWIWPPVWAVLSLAALVAGNTRLTEAAVELVFTSTVLAFDTNEPQETDVFRVGAVRLHGFEGHLPPTCAPSAADGAMPGATLTGATLTDMEDAHAFLKWSAPMSLTLEGTTDRLRFQGSDREGRVQVTLGIGGELQHGHVRCRLSSPEESTWTATSGAAGSFDVLGHDPTEGVAITRANEKWAVQNLVFETAPIPGGSARSLSGFQSGRLRFVGLGAPIDLGPGVSLRRVDGRGSPFALGTIHRLHLMADGLTGRFDGIVQQLGQGIPGRSAHSLMPRRINALWHQYSVILVMVIVFWVGFGRLIWLWMRLPR